MHTEPVEGRAIGRGRSGVVYFTRDPAGRGVARKVFGGDGMSKLVLYILTGAPNPYVWNEDAIQAAACRRRILSHLVRYWFGDTLRLPETVGCGWTDEHRAFELRTEFVRGVHAPLRHAPPDGQIESVDHLRRVVMAPLQLRLRQAGFDGLAWQAGLGNPVAANNFMLESGERGCLQPWGEDRAGGVATLASKQAARAPRWVWIDLESGVPALFPINPLALLAYYLPRSIKHGRPLFDDVDVAKLRRYLEVYQRDVEPTIGPVAYGEVLEQIAELDRRQTAWKSLGRAHRSIGYHLAKTRITPEQAEHYRLHVPRWYVRLLAVTAASSARKGVTLLARGFGTLWRYPWGRAARNAWGFSTSHRFRARLAHRYVSRRIGVWELRRCIERDTARQLRAELRSDVTSEYITDFGVHILLKPVDWVIFSLALGFQGVAVAAGVVIGGGVIVRTAYTLGRGVQALLRRQPLPWVALGVGLLPVIGNAAYPVQLLYTGETNRGLARFILYDVFSAVGRNFPVWGGKDTLTEHFFNRLPDLFRRRAKF